MPVLILSLKTNSYVSGKTNKYSGKITKRAEVQSVLGKAQGLGACIPDTRRDYRKREMQISADRMVLPGERLVRYRQKSLCGVRRAARVPRFRCGKQNTAWSLGRKDRPRTLRNRENLNEK